MRQDQTIRSVSDVHVFVLYDAVPRKQGPWRETWLSGSTDEAFKLSFVNSICSRAMMAGDRCARGGG
jgi:hypothetical protein